MSRAMGGVGVVAALALAGAVAGCQTNTGDAGCRINRQQIYPPTPLTQLDHARYEPLVGTDDFVLIGHDATAVRWATMKWDGTMGEEQVLPLPAGFRSPVYALGNASAPGDIVQVGLITDAGADAELHLLTIPIGGPTAVAPGPALVTFPGAAGTNPEVALAAGRLGTNAALAWVDAAEGVVNYAAVDGTGAMVGAPVGIDGGATFRCLQFTAGNDNATASYQRQEAGAETWMISELTVDGVFMNWSMPLAQPNVAMSCAVMTPTPTGYALGWQDKSGSWLSVHDALTKHIDNWPFASATDFGGPDLQPPIVGLGTAPAGVADAKIVDFGLAFQRTRAVEIWRLDRFGIRRPGALLLPSLEGKMGTASSALVGGSLVITYADYTPATQTGRRLVVDASCY